MTDTSSSSYSSLPQMSESCAACGKIDKCLKACGSCMSVKYCCVECQRSHWSAHKHACKKRTAELLDEKLFADPPMRDDCPVCFSKLPLDKHVYYPCCGKEICLQCRHSMTRDYCPFCNLPQPDSYEEFNKQVLERIQRYNDPGAINSLGSCHSFGYMGLPVDVSKAAELYRRACGIGGCASAHNNLAMIYSIGRGIELDKKKAVHHFQIAAMMGHEVARYNLGHLEEEFGNMDRAMRHFIIAAKCGSDISMQKVKEGFREGRVSKDDFEKALQAYEAA
eukprot:scaffold5580_cov61-Cyclotella_meneghiniana.AAC.9